MQLPPHLAASAAQRMEEIDTLRQILQGVLTWNSMICFSYSSARVLWSPGEHGSGCSEELPEPDVLVWIRWRS